MSRVFFFSPALQSRIHPLAAIGRWRARRATLRDKRATHPSDREIGVATTVQLPTNDLLTRGARRMGVRALALVLLGAAPAWAAKPDKPEKPDKVEKAKPDKVEKALKSERSSQSPRTPPPPAFPSRPEPSKKFNRSEKTSSRPPTSAPAAAPPVPAGSGFERFQAIAERNIFNPNRVPRSRETPAEPPRIDTVALVGVLQSDGGVVAFFHSENRYLQQIVREGETVAGLSVMRILPNAVELMQDGQPLTLRVNQQMRRVEGGSWKPLPREGARTEMARTADGGSPAAIPPGASEVLRRLMEQRQKQLKQ